MNRNVWLVAGIAVLLVAVVNILLGLNLVPTITVAEERGTAAGWWMIWTVIAVVVLCAVSLAAFLLAAGLGKVTETAD